MDQHERVSTGPLRPVWILPHETLSCCLSGKGIFLEGEEITANCDIVEISQFAYNTNNVKPLGYSCESKVQAALL